MQEEVENKIETADALAVKLLQRFNYSASAMRSTAQNLAEGNYPDIPHSMVKKVDLVVEIDKGYFPTTTSFKL
jgi:hypothetical protein